MSALKKIFTEIEHLSLIVTIPQLISAPVSFLLMHLFSHYPAPNDILEVLDFLVISFPLTLAVALITYLVRNDETPFTAYFFIVIGAALLSNFLHSILSSAFPAIDVGSAYREAFEPDDYRAYHGAGTLISLAFKIVSLYWKKFGIMMFLQSMAIGIYAGTKYFKVKQRTPF